MSFFDLLWLFLIFSSLQPILRQRWLEAQRLRAFRRLESRRQSRLIGLIHRQETMSFLGFPIARYIDIEDSEQVLRAIGMTDPSVPIDLSSTRPAGSCSPRSRSRLRSSGTRPRSRCLSRTTR